MIDVNKLSLIIACLLYKVGGTLDISKELLESVKPVRLMVEDLEEGKTLRLTILSNEIIVGEADVTTGITSPVLVDKV